MDGDLRLWKEDRLLRLLIALVGVHSLVLGTAMLVATRFLLATFGFPAEGSIFFATQSGVYLVILGVLYLGALSVPPFVWSIVLSKTLAVIFLLVHAAFAGAPPIIWLAAAGDAGMLAAVVVLLLRHRRLAAASRRLAGRAAAGSASAETSHADLALQSPPHAGRA